MMQCFAISIRQFSSILLAVAILSSPTDVSCQLSASPYRLNGLLMAMSDSQFSLFVGGVVYAGGTRFVNCAWFKFTERESERTFLSQEQDTWIIPVQSRKQCEWS